MSDLKNTCSTCYEMQYRDLFEKDYHMDRREPNKPNDINFNASCVYCNFWQRFISIDPRHMVCSEWSDDHLKNDK